MSELFIKLLGKIVEFSVKGDIMDLGLHPRIDGLNLMVVGAFAFQHFE